MVIRLFCAAGMSTSLLVKKMEEAAKEKGKDVDIVAYPFTEMERVIEGVDVALLGPQVGYQLARAKEICDPNINTVLYNFLGLVFALIRVRKHWWDDIPMSSVMDCVLAESYVK